MTQDRKFKTLFMSIPDGFYLSEPLYDESGNLCDYRYLEVNPEFERIVGLPREQIIGKRYRELVPVDTTGWFETYRTVARTGIPKTFEFYSGEYRMYFETYSYLADKNQIAVLVRDITSRKESLDDLAKSEAKFRSLFNASTDAIIIGDSSGLVLEANRAAETLFGYSHEEMTQLPLTALMPERYRTDHLRAYHQISPTPGTSYLNHVLEFHGLTRDGREFPIELNVAVWFVDQERYCSGIIRNISARKKIEAELRESEEKLNVIFNSTSDGILVADAETRTFVTGNKAICEMLGYTLDELVGLSVDDIHPTESLEEVHLKFTKQLRKEIDIYHNAPMMRKDNTVFLADIRSTPVTFAGKACLIGVLRDATERIRMEEKIRQSQKLEAIGTLAGGIAHDFNNILAPIIGYTELVMASLPSGSEEQSLLDQVKKASLRAKDLVRQILSFSRKSDQEKSPFRIQPIIKEALKLLRSSIPSSIEIKQELDEHCGPVLCAPTQIHQIVMNLCTNAYHAMMPEGGILKVSLDAAPESKDGHRPTESPAGVSLRLTVSDTGRGMDNDTMGRIFEPYFTTKGKGEGTGLGLSVVHGIVTDHNGTITAISAPGQGTTFTVYLPEAALPESAMEKAPSVVPTGTERILVIDDEADIVKMLTIMLQSLGYQVTAMTDSVEALDLFREHSGRFDLVITDQTMPRIPGTELAKRMIDIDPEIPIILCTGYSSMISQEKAERIGIRHIFMKPVMRDEMAQMIRSVLDRR